MLAQQDLNQVEDCSELAQNQQETSAPNEEFKAFGSAERLLRLFVVFAELTVVHLYRASITRLWVRLESLCFLVVEVQKAPFRYWRWLRSCLQGRSGCSELNRRDAERLWKWPAS